LPFDKFLPGPELEMGETTTMEEKWKEEGRSRKGAERERIRMQGKRQEKGKRNKEIKRIVGCFYCLLALCRASKGTPGNAKCVMETSGLQKGS